MSEINVLSSVSIIIIVMEKGAVQWAYRDKAARFELDLCIYIYYDIVIKFE